MGRLQLAVQAGKGGKSRLTMIPQKLAPGLAAHRERLRILHAKNREANAPRKRARLNVPGESAPALISRQ